MNLKTAEKWDEEGVAYRNAAAAIQLNALMHAASLARLISRGTKSEERAIALDEVETLILEEAAKLVVKNEKSIKNDT